MAFGAAYVAHHLVTMGSFKMMDSDHREVAAMRALGESDPEAVGLHPSLRDSFNRVVDAVSRGPSEPLRLFSSEWLAAARFKS
jgi:hypothetical protein